MDTRAVVRALNQIGDLLELSGAGRFRAGAYRNAARAIRDMATDDLHSLARTGELAEVRGIGPSTLSVVTELLEMGESSYLERLRSEIPEGLVELLGLPGLRPEMISKLRADLGVDSLDALEAVARDGRLAALPRIGSKTVAKILAGIERAREQRGVALYPHALAESNLLLVTIMQHPAVEHAAVAGPVRRRCEVIAEIDIVAACQGEASAVARALASGLSGRKAGAATNGSVAVRLVDGTRLNLHCVPGREFAVALWRATGSPEHVRDVERYAKARGLTVAGNALLDASEVPKSIASEVDFYASLGLPFIEPELREGLGEVQVAIDHALPALVSVNDIRGVLHCHTHYSDGSASIADMVAAAQARGWSYLGISDHSRAAVYAGGLSPDAVHIQHDEIDRINDELRGASSDFRVLKGIEADILLDGRLDYEPDLLDQFDYVIGSVHSRLALDQAAMTARLLRAMDDPHLTILGHPTGRLLLRREPYAIDLEAVLEKAAALGVAVELNADPRRLDLDWRHCQVAKRLGCTIEIGPDAHSIAGLGNVEIGVGIARKGWLGPADVLNAKGSLEVLNWAASRRAGARL